MSEIDHELKIEAPPERVFAALTTLEGVRGWHAPAASGSGEVGGEWVFPYADHPEFRWDVTESEAPTRVAWRCTRGPGDSVGTTATFTLEPVDGRTLVELRHAGWPGTHGNFRKCNTTWGVLLHHLRDYVETGQPATAFE
ncbi:SRPBCC domain-containing protein [Mycolicibacterium sp. P1-18]|uniref:SRPBCC family protein n=1 Tax=Mycolicibacterium sp. P1-18 TaxID=2024615 RepID=UPI0011F34E18|nr:SRPBCC domain-containing protein [Mycolicibacterium sp. P1-18]KAA0096132.1 SRPBCC domain-containing protein [Mycolicibacterium sp. P1-18]